MLPVLGALVGVLVGQLGPEVLRRRAIAEARYDDAISGIGRLIAARQGVGIRIPEEWARSPDETSHEQLEHELSSAALKRYFEASAAARAALAELHPWSPDLRPYWDGPVISEDDFEDLVSLLVQRRKKPFTRYSKPE